MVCAVGGGPGEVLDCEACGSTLKAAPSSKRELRLEVQPLSEGGFEFLAGLSAFGEGADPLLGFGQEEESVRMDRLGLAEALARLEEGVLLLRRIRFLGAQDLLAFTLPSGSAYEFPFRKALAYPGPFLRR